MLMHLDSLGDIRDSVVRNRLFVLLVVIYDLADRSLVVFAAFFSIIFNGREVEGGLNFGEEWALGFLDVVHAHAYFEQFKNTRKE